MKTLIDNYSFDASARTVTFTDIGTIDLDRILLITNVTDNVIIYNFSDSAFGGTVATNVLTLTYDTTAQDDADKLQIFYDVQVRDLKANQQTTITSSVAETTIVSAVASKTLDLYGLTITNTSSLGTKVTIKDATAGTTRFVFWVPANDTRGFMLNENTAVKQSAANNNWTATCGTAVNAIEITALTVQTV